MSEKKNQSTNHNYHIKSDIDSKNQRIKGHAYEDMATDFLKDKGYTILEQNYFCKIGEVDIIARCDNTVVFVEVKYRKNDSYGNPLEAVTQAKMRKICRVADFYMMSHKLGEVSARFDVIGVLGNEITHIENAFEYR